MKKILQISSLFLMTSIYAQQISDYQYILVPTKFNDSKANRFGLNDLLISKLKSKNFIVFNETLEQQPEQISNPCEILKAEISDASNFLTNKSRITFKDCGDKIVAFFEGKSNIKDFEPGMRAALQNAVNNISPSMQIRKNFAVEKDETSINMKNAITNKDIQHVSSEKETVASTTPKGELKTTDKVESYSNGKLFLKRIFLSNGEFLLVNPNSSVPFATFKVSSKKDTYRVQLHDGTSTLGYIENGNILVEIPNSDGTFKNEIFELK